MGAKVNLIADEDTKHLDDWGTRMKGKPTKSEIHWWWRTEMPGWYAHFVKVTDLVGSTLKFRGVRLSDVDITFGPQGDEDPNDYSVDLDELRHVYRLRPSSLEGYVKGSEDCYAILLLSKYYITGKSKDIYEQYPDAPPADPKGMLRFASSTGGPKYPVSQEEESAIAVLTQQLEEEKERRIKAIAEAKEIFAALGMKSNKKVADWDKNWSP